MGDERSQIQRRSTAFMDFVIDHRSYKEGFNLKPAANYDNLYYAAFLRAIGDWLLGMNATAYIR
jgi:DNA topoisomerase IA